MTTTCARCIYNAMEETWTGLRNFLRPFRGVSKWYLAGYVAIFEWSNDLKRVTDDLLRLLTPALSKNLLSQPDRDLGVVDEGGQKVRTAGQPLEFFEPRRS